MDARNETTTALGANLTQLDFFGLSLQLDNYGHKIDLTAPEHLQSGFGGAARSAIVDRIKGLGEPWSRLVLPDLNPPFPGVPLRILSPYHGMELDLFPTDQLTEYIDRVWTYYKTRTLHVTVSGRNYTGRVLDDGPDGGLFVFEPPDDCGLRIGQGPTSEHEHPHRIHLGIQGRVRVPAPARCRPAGTVSTDAGTSLGTSVPDSCARRWQWE